MSIDPTGVEPASETVRAGQPSDGAPWAMQLVARVEKNQPPEVADLCASAALATIGLLERAQTDEPAWQVAIDEWTSTGRIRKLVRRGRGAAWERAGAAPGVTAASLTGSVRAFVPSPMDAVPDVVSSLQIRSSPLDEPHAADRLPPFASGSLVVALTPEVPMTWGKRCAQSAHAAQLLWTRAEALERAKWVDGGRAVSVVRPVKSLWPSLVERAVVEVRDGGFTEVEPGTFTALAFWAEPE